MQIALTFRNNPPNVKMQRFAADGRWRVLYYEEARLALSLEKIGGGSEEQN